MRSSPLRSPTRSDVSAHRRPRLVSTVTRARRGRRCGSVREARARYERAAEALEGSLRLLLETVARVGSLAWLDADLWRRCWQAHDRFRAARNALWAVEHGPGDAMGWNGDVRQW